MEISHYILVVVTSKTCALCWDLAARGVIAEIKRLTSRLSIRFSQINVEAGKTLPNFLKFIIMYPSFILMPVNVYQFGVEGKINARYALTRSRTFACGYDPTNQSLVDLPQSADITVDTIENFMLSSIRKFHDPKNSIISSAGIIEYDDDNSPPIIIKAYPRYQQK